MVVGTGVVLLQTLCLIRGSTRNLGEALAAALTAPYAFYLTNPSSGVLARLADDQRRVDDQLSRSERAWAP